MKASAPVTTAADAVVHHDVVGEDLRISSHCLVSMCGSTRLQLLDRLDVVHVSRSP